MFGSFFGPNKAAARWCSSCVRGHVIAGREVFFGENQRPTAVTRPAPAAGYGFRRWPGKTARHRAARPARGAGPPAAARGSGSGWWRSVFAVAECTAAMIFSARLRGGLQVLVNALDGSAQVDEGMLHSSANMRIPACALPIFMQLAPEYMRLVIRNDSSTIKTEF